MNKEELAREINKNVKHGLYFQITVEEIAEYLLSNYHLIPIETKCYEGKLHLFIEDRGNLNIGKERFLDTDEKIEGKYARLFVEEK
jgi:hypothetical protein